MNKRVTIEIPEDIYRLLSRYGDLHGLDADDYATMALGRHLEDIRDIAVANAEIARIRSGESKTVPLEEVWRELED